MLDLRYVAEHTAEVRAALARRSAEAVAQLDAATPILARRSELIGKTEGLQKERNSQSEEMAQLAKSGDRAAMAARRDALKALSEQVKTLEGELSQLETEIEDR